jgi:hypothetical protein
VDLALARIRDNVGRLRGPLQRSVEQSLPRRIAGRVKVPQLRHCLGAALAVALVGIGVNALLLQRERHPAPLFGSAPAPRPAPAPALAAAPPPRPVSAEHDAPPALSLPAPSPAALPPARPAAAADSSPSSPDPIAALLAGEAHSDGSRLVLAAQNALSKLGYPVKPDGNEGAATEQALRDFQRAHGLPPSTEITERLVKQLTQAARGGGR